MRSHFRAQWSGIVTMVTPWSNGGYSGLSVEVLVTHDRNGNPMRKMERHVLEASWLELLSKL